MTYALVQDGKIVTIGLPSVGTLKDGSAVSNFDKLDAETLKKEGWLPIEDSGLPQYDPSTQQVAQTFTVAQNKVTAVYDVTDLPTPEPAPPNPSPSVAERLDALELAMTGIRDRVGAVVLTAPDSIKVRDAVVGPKDK